MNRICAARSNQPPCIPTQSAAGLSESLPSSDLRDRRLAVQEPEDEGEDESEDPPQEQPRLTAIGPYRPDHDPGAPARPEGRDVARKIAVARVRIRPSHSETAQLRFDSAPVGASENVEPRAGGVEGERVGKTRASGFDLVALRALGLELADEVVMTVGSGSRGPVGIAARVANLIKKARIVDLAGRAIKGGVGRARNRDRRVAAGRCVDAGKRHALQRVSASRRRSELLDRLREAHQRERLAGAGRSQIPARNGVWTRGVTQR